MPIKDQLTNESLKGLFKNNFNLANYAIRLGRYYIKSGHEISLEGLLDQVRRHPNEQYLKDLQEADSADDTHDEQDT
jgi:hypothetical protein